MSDSSFALVPVSPPALRAGAVMDYVEIEQKDAFGMTLPPAGRFVLEGSPAAAELARRLFPAQTARKADKAIFEAHPDDVPDIDYLISRWAVDLTPAASARLEDLRRRGSAPDHAEIGGSWFRGVLKPYQEGGVDYLLSNARALLADEMGLGKTVQALAAIDRARAYPAVIVCPPHLVAHWAAKAGEFLGAYETGSLPTTGGGPRYAVLKGTRIEGGLPPAEIYIVHYLTLYAWAKLLADARPLASVWDEAQEMRSDSTRKAAAIAQVSDCAMRSWGLTGTPIHNRGLEMFTVMNALRPGCLGTKGAFVELWCNGYDKRVVTDPHGLGEYLRDRAFMLRRTKDEAALDLPEKSRFTQALEISDGDAALFRELIREAADLARQAGDAEGFERARLEAEAIASARRATGVAKSAAVGAFVRGILETEEPTLVFVHHHAVIDKLKAMLQPFAPSEITGRMTLSQKVDQAQRFISGETNCCIIGLRAAAGLDGLQARARVVVMGELDWSPAVHRQAEDRAHRMGQLGSVLVYYLVSLTGFDSDMMEVLALKEGQLAGVLDEDAPDEAALAANAAAAKRHMSGILDRLRRMA